MKEYSLDQIMKLGEYGNRPVEIHTNVSTLLAIYGNLLLALKHSKNSPSSEFIKGFMNDIETLFDIFLFEKKEE